MENNNQLCRNYFTILEGYLKEHDEQCLFDAAELGREMVTKGFGVEEVAEVHHQCLNAITQNGYFTDTFSNRRKAMVPLTELLMAYGMSHRRRENSLQEAVDGLKHSKQRILDFAEVASDWFWEMDENLRFSFFSSRFGVVTAQDPKRILGRTFKDYKDSQALLDKCAWDRHYEDLQMRRPFRDFVCSHRNRNGIIRWFSISGKPIFNEHGGFKGYRGTGSDITEEMKAKKEAETAHLNYRSLVEGSVQGVLVHRHQKPLYVNDAYVKIFGYSSVNEVIQLESIIDTISPEDRDRIVEFGDARLNREKTPEHYVFMGLRQDGSNVWIDCHNTLIDWDGEPAIQSTQYDITEGKLLEGQLRQAQKMEAIGQLAGGVAHDFNNVLQIISGFSDLSKRNIESDPKQAIEDIDFVISATAKASDLTRQLLSFSRNGKLEKKVLDINEVMSNIIRLVRRIIGDNVDIEFVTHNDEILISADPGMMEQVMMNLCVNARDAMPDGGKIVVETKLADADERFYLTRDWANEAVYCQITVKDTGLGMDDKTIGRIFEPFFTTKDKDRGTGLGLSVVYGIIQQHDGVMEVNSQVGLGTNFDVYLPVVTEEKQEMNLITQACEIGGNETILVAEDNQDVLNLVVGLLSDKGYVVHHACDGASAVELFAKCSNEIDLVMVDMVMPQLSGPDVWRQIKKIRPQLPVLFTTGYAGCGTNEDFLVKENLSVIRKPYFPSDLYKCVRDILDAS